ncbi:HdeD family acid-resistance protein [Loktanella sp. IMCC34160]|uniref:HdeD family acid-resistance protein n=1 Tax=Loktanella sp. IMCC34160 TaxID=2510646 RepID=UPI00101CF07C|nr:HdeD family acid-resistance protein [Loktanella sp. IMCC34160]RYG89338.1 HdeD family acid-resistance protein [Loktanella sp. IMCC34160]
MSDLPPEFKQSDLYAAIKSGRDRFQRLGWILIGIGVLAILFPLVASIATKVLVGVVFLVAGGFTLHHAFWARDWGSAIWSGLSGFLQLAVGVYLAFFPLTGLVGLTFLVGLAFLVQGAMEMFIAFQHRPGKGWAWMGFSGLASLVLGAMLISGLPGTALWAIGLLMGLNALTTGISFVVLARSV